jgi:hypothetical protein
MIGKSWALPTLPLLRGFMAKFCDRVKHSRGLNHRPTHFFREVFELLDIMIKNYMGNFGMKNPYLALFSFLMNLTWTWITLLVVARRVDIAMVKQSLSTLDVAREAFLLSTIIYAVLAIVEILLYRRFSASNPSQSALSAELPRLAVVAIFLIMLNHFPFLFWVCLFMLIYGLLFSTADRFLPSLTRLFNVQPTQEKLWQYWLKLMLGFFVCHILMMPVLFVGANFVINQQMTIGGMLMAQSIVVPALASLFRLLNEYHPPGFSRRNW